MRFPHIALLAILNALNYLDRYLLGSVLPVLEHDLLLTKLEAGWIVSAFIPGYVIFAPIFGYLGDRFSRPRLMILGVVIWSLATIATGFASNFWLLLLIRALVGVGEASFVTISPGFIKDHVKNPIQTNSLLSIFYAAIPIGSALGYVTGGAFAEGYPRWMAFLVGGVPGLLLVPFLFRLTDIPGRRPPPNNIGKNLREILSVPVLWFVIGGYTLNAMALNGIAPWVTSYGEQIGFSLAQIGVAFGGILVCAGFIGTFGGGRLASRLAERSDRPGRTLIVFAGVVSLLGAPFLAVAFMTDDHMTFLVCCFIAEVLIFASTAPINTLIVTTAPVALVTLAQGLSIFALNVFGAFPAAPLVGKLTEWTSLATALQLLCVPLVLSGMIWIAGKFTYDVHRGKS